MEVCFKKSHWKHWSSDLSVSLLHLHLYTHRVAISLHVRCPECEVVAQQLHDQGAVLVALLAQGVQLRNGLVEGLLCQMAGTLGRVEDLVIEDTEVKGQTQADGVRWWQVHKSDVLCCLVGKQRVLGCLFAICTGLELGQVAVVVALHLQVEDLALASGCSGDEVLVKELQNAGTDVAQLLLHQLAVRADALHVVLIALALLLLLYAANDPPRSPAGSDHILIRHRQQVALLH
mmetsp:Transcript_2923/g.5010  ORF Transcript_2923/g.5010 Transcript_2923/m.5010 type:complete len:233 (+) Transcript_2923:722-1420(+)